MEIFINRWQLRRRELEMEDGDIINPRCLNINSSIKRQQPVRSGVWFGISSNGYDGRRWGVGHGYSEWIMLVRTTIMN